MTQTSAFTAKDHARIKADSNSGPVLVVSENPEFIHLAYVRLAGHRRVIGCAGPAQSRCNLETRHFCPLAKHASIALIESPSSGFFSCHWKVESAGSYAEALQRAHPECTVVLGGAPESSAGPTGEVTTAASALSALNVIGQIVQLSESDNYPKGDSK